MLYFLLSLIPFLIYVILKTKKSLHMHQLNWYNLDFRYLKWVIKNPYKVFVDLDGFFVIFFTFLCMNSDLANILLFIFYICKVSW